MKKLGLSILLSANLLLALDLSGVFFKNTNVLGKSHGGQNYDIDAYSDGVGVFVKSVTPEASVNFEKFNKSVLERGSEAKSNGISITSLFEENIEGVVRGFVDPKQQEKAKRLAAIPDELKNYNGWTSSSVGSFSSIPENSYTTCYFNGKKYKFSLSFITITDSGIISTNTVHSLDRTARGEYQPHYDISWHGKTGADPHAHSYIFFDWKNGQGVRSLYFHGGEYNVYYIHVPENLKPSNDVLFRDHFNRLYRLVILSKEHPNPDDVPVFVDDGTN